MTSVDFRLKSLKVSLDDGNYDNLLGQTSSIPIQLMEVCLSEVEISSKTCQFLETRMARNPFLAF